MTAARLHLLGQAALCFQQAEQYADAARCAEKAGEVVAAAEMYAAAGDLVKAADCYRRAGLTEEAARCLITLGRPADAAQLWQEAGSPLTAGWLLAAYARDPLHARVLLSEQARRPEVTPDAPGPALRRRIALELCAALERQPNQLAEVLGTVEAELPAVQPASERATVVRWAVQAADEIRRPDLASRAYAAGYRSRVPGMAQQWRGWARLALGGSAGIPDRDLLCRRGAAITAMTRHRLRVSASLASSRSPPRPSYPQGRPSPPPRT